MKVKELKEKLNQFDDNLEFFEGEVVIPELIVVAVLEGVDNNSIENRTYKSGPSCICNYHDTIYIYDRDWIYDCGCSIQEHKEDTIFIATPYKSFDEVEEELVKKGFLVKVEDELQFDENKYPKNFENWLKDIKVDF